MISDYLQAISQQAIYERMPDGASRATIPNWPELWAQGATPDECRQELLAVLEAWAQEHLAARTPLPEVNGVRLLSDEAACCPFTPTLLGGQG